MNLLKMSPTLDQADPTILPRLVGFYEYGKAVDLLGDLVSNSTKEEIEVYNDIISQHSELDIYTNLSRKVETRGSALAEFSTEQADDFKRSGLDWMLALAKIELAAMMASYSDAKDPFAAVAPTEFEKTAYAELLLDGARYHYWSLGKDAIARRILQQSNFEPSSETVAYVRRVALSRLFLVAAINYRGQGWSDQQMNEAGQWLRDLDAYRSQLVQAIVRYLSKTETYASQGKSSVERTVSGDADTKRIISRYCGKILDGERAEISSGSATVQVQTTDQ